MTDDQVTVAIPESTQAIIEASTFRIGKVYRFLKAGSVTTPEKHLLVSRDERETTVVTLDENLDDVEVIETNPDRWILFTIDCANPFYCVGFIAAVANLLVAMNVDVLVVSTFTRDLFFVKEAETGNARDAMLKAGFKEAVD